MINTIARQNLIIQDIDGPKSAIKLHNEKTRGCGTITNIYTSAIMSGKTKHCIVTEKPRIPLFGKYRLAKSDQ